MGYTKGEIVEAALTELGIAGEEFDILPEQLAKDIRRLDSMMAEWTNRGILLYYPTSSIPGESSKDQETGIPDIAIEAVITNLALRLAPSYGKQVLPDTKLTARSALNSLLSTINKPLERQFPVMPKGAGYKAIDFPFTDPPEERHLEPVDESIDFSGGLNGA